MTSQLQIQNRNERVGQATNSDVISTSDLHAPQEGLILTEVDSLERFKLNLVRLEESSSRLRFMMKEISYLLSRKLSR